MATVDAYTVADMFLRALNAPSTPAMRRAVAIWLRFESGGTITGNNPWNLHGGTACPKDKGYCPGNVGVHKGQIGNRYAGPGDRNVAVFATLQDGVAASAQNLIRLAPSYGYGKVISEARAGDALGFLTALQNSSWSAGHYGYSKLVNAFKGTFSYNTSFVLRNIGGGTTGNINPAEALNDTLKKLGISTDDAHVITEDEAKKLAGTYNVTGSVFDAIVRTFTGKTVGWLRENGSISTTPLPGEPGGIGAGNPLGDIAGTLEDTIGQVGDVLLFVLGITVGGILTFYGLSMLLSAGRTNEADGVPHQPIIAVPEGSTIHVPGGR